MGLELNLPNEIINYACSGLIEKYKPFNGAPVVQLGKIADDVHGRFPMHIAGIFCRDMYLRNGPEDVKKGWIQDYKDTFDLGIYDERKRNQFGVIFTVDKYNQFTDLGESLIKKLNPNAVHDRTLLAKGGIHFFEEIYKQKPSDGVMFLRLDDNEFYGPFNQEQALRDKKLRVLFRDCESVPDDFAMPDGFYQEIIKYVFSEVKQRFGLDHALEITPEFDRKGSSIRHWCKRPVSEGFMLNNKEKFNNDNCHLVGELMGW